MLYIKREKDVYENCTYREREIIRSSAVQGTRGMYRKRECTGELQLDKKKEGCKYRRAVQEERGICVAGTEKDVQK